MAKLQKQEVGFTQVKNEVLNDKRLSWKAKGIFAYIFSKPDGWDFSGHRISIDTKDGKKATYAGLKELEKLSYLARRKNSDGRISYELRYQLPDVQKGDLAIIGEKTEMAEKPDVQKGKEPKRLIAEMGTISNTDLIQTKKDKNKESISHSKTVVLRKKEEEEINSFIPLFEPINPNYTDLFRNTTQRTALITLVSKHGREKIERLIRALPSVVAKKYAPRITTPVQLLAKLPDLIIFMKQNKSTKPTFVQL